MTLTVGRSSQTGGRAARRLFGEGTRTDSDTRPRRSNSTDFPIETRHRGDNPLGLCGAGPATAGRASIHARSSPRKRRASTDETNPRPPAHRTVMNTRNQKMIQQPSRETKPNSNTMGKMRGAVCPIYGDLTLDSGNMLDGRHGAKITKRSQLPACETNPSDRSDAGIRGRTRRTRSPKNDPGPVPLLLNLRQIRYALHTAFSSPLRMVSPTWAGP